MMNDFIYNLPPINLQAVKCDKIDLEGYLELEVTLINFVITANTGVKLLYSGKLPKNQITYDKKNEKETERFSYDTSLRNVIINNKNCASVNEFKINRFKKINSVEQSEEVEDERGNCNRSNLLDSVQVKFIWFGECAEDGGNISIRCKVQHTEQLKLKTKRKCNQRLKIYNQKNDQIYKHQQLQDRRQYLLLSANNKLRYRICTNGALFLEYLCSCKPIKIIVSAGSDSCLARTKPLGQAEFCLPLALLKKFRHNIGKGHNFKYKTKIYTLYYQNKESVQKDLVKTGEIQLCFKMLFAPTVAASASAVAASRHTNVMHDKNHLHNHYHHQRHNHHFRLSGKSSKVAEDIQGDIPNRLTSQTKSEEIVEAMKKLDAKLVAYLAGETDISSKLTNCEDENEVNLNLENNNISNNLEDLLPATKFNIFKQITAIKLEVEALTLQPEGTKCMNLMQNEIEPIFTVECQLSNELIKLVPRHDMYHIMQFESEKFQSLTQCTRFAQKAERLVKLDLNPSWSDENANETVHDFGRVHFTVWWREPGTCLNAMLGMGVLDLNDLYSASLLEQCKRIQIQRRGKHLACLYFKVTLQRDVLKSNTQIKREMFLPKQISADSDSDTNRTTDNNKNNTVGQQQSAAAQCALQSNTTANSSISGTDKALAQNNNVKLETTNFEDETSKIRLLKGFVSANETKNIEISLPSQTFLICRRFWLEEPASAKSVGSCKFNYQEQFSIINDDKFLQRMDKQFLHLELWQRMSCDDGNGNIKENAQPIGMARMPLHQFFIAYKDAAITNHLCKGKLPVISIDAWAPIINCQTGLNMGEIKCLLAMGSDEQIKNLKETRGITVATTSDVEEDREFINKLQPLQIPTTSKANVSAKQSITDTASTVNTALSSTNVKKTSELLDMLQKALLTSSSKASDSQQSDTVANPSTTTSTAPKYYNNTASLPLKPSNVKLFKFSLEIQKAIGLPLNPASKVKKGYSKRNASKRFPPNEAPSCYVTFQAEEGQYPTYKSHEGTVFATNIIEKSTQPQWQQRFRLAASIDYLKTPQKLFILKVLKKSSADVAQGRAIPTPLEDAIIGLTALDLSAFARGLHIAGSFNIVDFNGRINGQLIVRCHPLDEIVPSVAAALPSCSAGSSVDSVIDQFEQTLDLAHLNLGQAIKRKFNELEGISQRLRARLGDVTGSALPKDFNLQTLNTWEPIENEVNDDKEIDEFEQELNTPPLSDDETFEARIDNQKCQGKYETDNVEKTE